MNELDRIAAQIDKHLSRPARITRETFRHPRLNIDNELQPLALYLQREESTMSLMTPPNSMSIASSSNLPASIFEKSSMSLMMVSSAPALLRIV